MAFFIDWIKNRLNPSERLGVDILGEGLRIVQLKRSHEKKLVLAACRHLDFKMPGASPLECQKIRLALGPVSGNISRVAISLEDPTLLVRRMEFAKMPERDLLEAIRWNFREHISCPMEKYAVGFTPIRGYGDEKKQILVAYGVAKEAIERHREIARSLGLNLLSLEPVATSLLAAFHANLTWETGGYVGCVWLGEKNSYFLAMTEGQLLFSRPLMGISQMDLKKILVKNLSDSLAADNFLKKWLSGSVPAPAADSVPENTSNQLGAEAISEFFSQLVLEAQRSIDAFCLLYNTDHLDGLYLCGTGALYPGIVPHVQKTLGLATKIFDPFEKIEKENLGVEPKLLEPAPLYAVAVGLAIP